MPEFYNVDITELSELSIH